MSFRLKYTEFNDSLVEEEKVFLIDGSLKFRTGKYEEFTTFSWRDLSGVSKLFSNPIF